MDQEFPIVGMYVRSFLLGWPVPLEELIYILPGMSISLFVSFQGTLKRRASVGKGVRVSSFVLQTCAQTHDFCSSTEPSPPAVVGVSAISLMMPSPANKFISYFLLSCKIK